jgi:hypothetical protein
MMWVHLCFWSLGQILSWSSVGLGMLVIASGGLSFAYWRRPPEALRGVGFATVFWMVTISLHVVAPSLGQTPVSAWMVTMLGITA